MENLTNQELIAKAKQYDHFQNEGGEGYNPYWSELEKREMEETAKKAAQPKTKKEQITSLQEKIRKECGSVAREWGGDEIDKKQAAYYAEIKKLEAEIESEFLSIWTPEETARRRKEWNDFAKALIGNKKRITPGDARELGKRQSDQGWTVDNLKKAVKLNNL